MTSLWVFGGGAFSSAAGAREIPFSALDGVRVRNAQDDAGLTGVTVFCFPDGAKTGVDIRCGSAYGLAASDGVMKCLEENGVGYDTGFALVPLVVQSCIYDLSYGSASARPDAAMGYAACENALRGSRPVSGSVGAGTDTSAEKRK